MDPVSHLVMGRAVVVACDTRGLSWFGPGATAAALLGALAPDVDFVLMPVGWDVYLKYHEVATHSLVGACLLGGVVGLLVRAVVRTARLPALCVAAALAASSHLLLDLLSGGRAALAWPVSTTRLGLPLVAMAEPWLVSLFVAGAIAMWVAREDRRRAARALLVAAVMFFAVKAVGYERVRRVEALEGSGGSLSGKAIEARWGSWSEWHVFEKDQDALSVWRVNALQRTRVSVATWRLHPETPLMVLSRSLDTVDNFLSVHHLTFAVERPRASGQVEVLWSDARYCRRDQPGAERIECDLWFGGVFDSDGRVINQVVHLGGWAQTRPPSL